MPKRKRASVVRLYADGVFDMFHFGHARALEQAKKSFPSAYLIVGVTSDASTHAYKGRTVMTEDERYEALRHCKWVDEVIPDAPWVISPEFLEEHGIDYVCHDDAPYADATGQTDDVYAHVKKIGKFHATSRTEGISTSDIIMRIIKDYDEFVRRNLERGYSRHDLNVNYFAEKAILVSGMVDEAVEKTRKVVADIQQDFLELFSKQGKLRTALRRKRRAMVK